MSAARVVALVLVAVAQCAAAMSSPGFDEARPQLERSLLEAFRGDVATHADLPLHRVTARYDAAARTVIGRVRIGFVNTWGGELRDLGLVTFANSPSFTGAKLELLAVRVDDAAVGAITPVHDGAGQLVALAKPIAAGAAATADVDFALTLSEHGDHGLDAASGGAACLYAWFPELATRAGGEWKLHPLRALCDPCATTMTHVIAELDAPADLTVVSGGVTVDEREGDGRRVTTIASALTRSLAVMLGSGLERQEQQVRGITVRSFATKEDHVGCGQVLERTADSLALYDERFGRYPYAELDAVEMPLGEDVGGMESSGMIILDTSAYAWMRSGGVSLQSMPAFMMATVVSHEVGHQWWFGLVGNDPWTSPWLDESLTNWTCCWYVEERHGLGMAADGFRMSLAECMIPSAQHRALTEDAGAYQPNDYGATVYARGSLMYQALRRRIGDERFFAFLKRWCADHRYGVVDQAAWRAALARELGEPEADAFARKWLLADGLAWADLARVAQSAAPAKPEAAKPAAAQRAPTQP